LRVRDREKKSVFLVGEGEWVEADFEHVLGFHPLQVRDRLYTYKKEGKISFKIGISLDIELKNIN
jgi:hypothetical protein